MLHLAYFVVRKARLSPPRLQKLPVERREEPAFHFRCVSQLAAFGGPNIECLLCQITSLGFRPAQAESKLIKRLIVRRHRAFEVYAGSHTSAFQIRAGDAWNVPGRQFKLIPVESVQAARPTPDEKTHSSWEQNSELTPLIFCERHRCPRQGKRKQEYQNQ